MRKTYIKILIDCLDLHAQIAVVNPLCSNRKLNERWRDIRQVCKGIHKSKRVIDRHCENLNLQKKVNHIYICVAYLLVGQLMPVKHVDWSDR